MRRAMRRGRRGDSGAGPLAWPGVALWLVPARTVAPVQPLRFGAIVVPLLVVVALGSACRGMTSTKPPIHVNPSMDNQPKARAQSESDFFYDGASMRVPVPGTVARGELREDRAFFEGKDEKGNDLAHSPVEATPEVLARGRRPLPHLLPALPRPARRRQGCPGAARRRADHVDARSQGAERAWTGTSTT